MSIREKELVALGAEYKKAASDLEENRALLAGNGDGTLYCFGAKAAQ